MLDISLLKTFIDSINIFNIIITSNLTHLKLLFIMNNKTVVFSFIFAILGTICAQILFTPVIANAYGKKIKSDFFSVTGPNGKESIQIATYDGSYSKTELGQPLISMYSPNSKLKLLFRLAGENDSPTIIMKDNRGKDRIVMGLALSHPDQEPYIKFYDKNGKRKNILWSLLNQK